MWRYWLGPGPGLEGAAGPANSRVPSHDLQVPGAARRPGRGARDLPARPGPGKSRLGVQVGLCPQSLGHTATTALGPGELRHRRAYLVPRVVRRYHRYRDHCDAAGDGPLEVTVAGPASGAGDSAKLEPGRVTAA
jgi:hypothetical protein